MLVSKLSKFVVKVSAVITVNILPKCLANSKCLGYIRWCDD